MPAFSSSTTVHVTPERAWSLVRDFTGVRHWHPLVKSCTLVAGVSASAAGAIREVTLMEGPPMRERLEYCADAERRLEYWLMDAALPIRDYRARVSVLDHIEADKAIVVWQSSFEFVAARIPELQEFSERVVVSALEGLRNHCARL